LDIFQIAMKIIGASLSSSVMKLIVLQVDRLVNLMFNRSSCHRSCRIFL